MKTNTKYLTLGTIILSTSLFLLSNKNSNIDVSANKSYTILDKSSNSASYLGLRTIQYKNIDILKKDINLKLNDIVETTGYYEPNDGGAGKYIITNTEKNDDYGSVIALDNGLKAELIVENDIVNVKQFGVRSGLTKKEMKISNDIKKEDAILDNTFRIQKAINYCLNDKTLYFPSGWFLTDELDLGVGNNITISGVSNNMGAYLNKTNKDTFSKLLFVSDKNDILFKQEKCMMIFENIGFYGSATVDGINYGEKNKTLIEGSVVDGSNDLKGKVFAENCEFAEWNTVFGGATLKLDKNNNVVLKNNSPILNYKDSNIKKGSKVQVAVLATNCRFSNNNIAISQLVDGRIAECSFNKNGYAIVFGKSSGYTTVSNSRIEWSKYNGLLVDSAHDVTITNNEFDRSGHAGMYIVNSDTINVSGNILRRSGADESLNESDYIRNIHLYIDNNKNINVSNNITKVKYNYDLKINDNSNGKKGINRPSNVSNISNNKNIIVSSNILNGGNRNENSLNISSKNSEFIFENNIIKK